MNEKYQKYTKEFDLKAFTKGQVLKAGLQSAFDLSFPVAIWRLPHSNEVHFLSSTDKAIGLERVDFQELDKGFICSKFDTKKGRYFLPKDIYYSFDFDEVVSEFADKKGVSDFKTRMVENLSQSIERPTYYTSREQYHSASNDYIELVAHAIDEIKKGSFEKVVPARSKKIDLSDQFDVINLFLRLCETYENAFISFISLPKEGSWMGASPEILINTQGPIFTTVSLAGTRKWQEDLPISETSWNQKEIEEQAMVSRYIINCFKKIRLREFDEKGPKTAKAGNLLHLKTIFQVNMEETNFKELPTVMLDLLHPTSAVAGMPKEASIDFLKRHEGLDRSFYAGYLGPVHMQNATQLFVNLRCMQLFEKNALLYAGAGVTEDSHPEKEYLETEMKCNTLLNKIIHKI